MRRSRNLSASLVVTTLGILLAQLPVFGQTLFCATGANVADGELFTVDPATGVSTLVGGISDANGPIGITGLAFHPETGILYGVTGSLSPNDPRSLVTIDTNTANATLIGELGGTAPATDIDFDSNGVLYAWLGGGVNKLARINLSTGSATVVGPAGTGAGTTRGGAFAVSSTATLYVSRTLLDDGTTLFSTIDPNTGQLTAGPTLTGIAEYTSLNAMSFNAPGDLYAVNNNAGTAVLVLIDETTGAVSTIGALPDNTDGLAFDRQFDGPVLGIESAYSIVPHGSVGDINIPLNLTGQPTSDPRLMVNEIVVVFEAPVRPSTGDLTPNQVIITSSPIAPIPAYTVSFAQGGNVGQDLTIVFSEPLPDQRRYRISFENFVAQDGSPLSGDTDLEFRVLQGDTNNNGAVTATDVSFVRGRINETVAFGAASRADVNMSGSITGPDISFVRSRIGHSAP